MPLHEEQRDEHRDERGRERDDREADLLGALRARPRRASSPSSMSRATFSIITIASSTTKPVAMVSAISERLSSE
jgi:hypothetical protein